METTTTPAGTTRETRHCDDCEGTGRGELHGATCAGCDGHGEVFGYRCACGSDETEECACSVEARTDAALAQVAA